jgi:hypothetical protein
MLCEVVHGESAISFSVLLTTCLTRVSLQVVYLFQQKKNGYASFSETFIFT